MRSHDLLMFVKHYFWFSKLILYPIASTTYPKTKPTKSPTKFTDRKAFRFDDTSASADAPSNTNEPSPKVVINAANKPPNVSLFFYT